jgi:hypothetical protein
MNHPAASCRGSRGPRMTFPKLSPPNVLIGGPVPDSPVVSPVEPPLKACGNDGLWQCYQTPLRSKLREIERQSPRPQIPSRRPRLCKSRSRQRLPIRNRFRIGSNKQRHLGVKSRAMGFHTGDLFPTQELMPPRKEPIPLASARTWRRISRSSAVVSTPSRSTMRPSTRTVRTSPASTAYARWDTGS